MTLSATTNSTQTLRHDAQVIGLVGLAHGTSHFFHLILAPLFPWLKEAFALSYAELGLLMSVFFIVSGIGQALAGFLVDRTGALPVLWAGITCLALAAFGLSVSPNYGTLLFFAGVAGLGNSVFHPVDFTILNRKVAVPRLGHAFSAHGLSGTLGWALAPLFLAGITVLSSWRVALFSAGVLACVILLVLFMFRHLLRYARLDDGNRQTARKQGGHALGFMRLPAVWLCFAFFFIATLSFGGVQSFATSALRDIYGISLGFATTCISAYMLASAGGIITGGFLAARTSQHDRVVALALALAGVVAIIASSGWLSSALVIVLLALMGFGNGIAGPSRDLLVRAASPRGATGRVYGVVYSGLDMGLAISPLLFGALMDAHHPSWVFIMIGVFQALAITTALGIGEKAVRRQPQAA
jgi:MFS family permease